MTNQAIRDMILELAGELDYDVAKSLDPECAEEPEECEPTMRRLVAIAKKHLPKEPRAKR